MTRVSLSEAIAYAFVLLMLYAFLLSAYDDRRPSVTVAQLTLQLKELGVDAEPHVFSRGGHGFGMRPGELAGARWPVRAHDMVKDIGLL